MDKRLQTWYAFSMAWQLGFLVVIPILCFTFLGLWLDRTYHTTPYGLLGCIFLSFIVTMVEIFQLFKIVLKK